MTCHPPPVTLTEQQKAEICGILSVGCDRQTAADFIGCRLSDIRDGMQSDVQFLTHVRRVEAGAELTHMRCVQEATKEKKDWRAAVWWLERRSPERFGRRSPGAVTARQLKTFVTILIDTLSSEITHPDDRQRVMNRIREIGDAVEKLLREVQITSSEIAEAITSPENSVPENYAMDDVADGLLGLPGEDGSQRW
jgi:hypothetical protein